MATTEEVNSKRDEVEKKRQRLFDARAKDQQRQQEVSNDLTLAQLEAEEARLDAALARAGMTKADVKDASSEAFETAQTQKKAAEATAKAQSE